MEFLSAIHSKEKKLIVGLMSGTSLDGIDAALVEIEGHGKKTKVNLLEFETVAFTESEKGEILKLCTPETSSVDKICQMNVELGKKFSDAALHVIAKAGKQPNDIDLISSHGQTIYHMPHVGATLQIGELAVISTNTGCVTVGDFRPSDMAVGGQGAPLVPFVDYLLFHDPSKGRILLNIGGMSNITVIPSTAKEDYILAFDTGPGNVLIDAIVQICTNGKETFDLGGNFAKAGMIDSQWLQNLVDSDTFVHKTPPKSTGREYYTTEMAQNLMSEGRERGLSFESIIATVTQFTVETIALNIEQCIQNGADISEILVGGGGVHNTFIMEQLQKRLKQNVLSMEAINVSSDAKEAVAFAILGNEFIHGNTNNLPSATGAKRKTMMGKLVLP
ncbi:anhydro-N-acetylmuramic acid kinase [Cytobacillus suaedae]|nr:anhydro-N-acetylmuramic acid kinase [Cytobacillus suaedae]